MKSKYVVYVLVFVACCVTVSYATLYFSNSEVATTIVENLKRNIGDFLWGTIGILLTFASTLLLFLTFNTQQKQFKDTQQDAFRTRFEGTFSTVQVEIFPKTEFKFLNDDERKQIMQSR